VGSGEERKYVPLLFVRLSEFELDPVNTVYAINEEDKDEDEGDLHAIL